MNAVEQKIMDNKGLINYVINKFFPTRRNDEDYYQVGLIALWKAVESYKEDDSKAKFSTYALKCIKNDIIKEIEKEMAQKRTLSEGTKMVYLDNTTSETDVLVRETIGYRDERDVKLAIKAYCGKICHKRRKALHLLFLGYSTSEVAKAIGVSKTTVNSYWKDVKGEMGLC